MQIMRLTGHRMLTDTVLLEQELQGWPIDIGDACRN